MIQLLIPVLTSFIDRVFPDQEKAAEAKAEMMTILADAQAKEMQAKAAVVVAEAQGESYMQRNWRPMLMFLFMIIIAFNFILAPLSAMLGFPIPTLPIPEQMWVLITVGVGGYIGSRGYEKVTREKSVAQIYQGIRDVYGPISQEQFNELKRKIE